MDANLRVISLGKTGLHEAKNTEKDKTGPVSSITSSQSPYHEDVFTRGAMSTTDSTFQDTVFSTQRRSPCPNCSTTATAASPAQRPAPATRMTTESDLQGIGGHLPRTLTIQSRSPRHQRPVLSVELEPGTGVRTPSPSPSLSLAAPCSTKAAATNTNADLKATQETAGQYATFELPTVYEGPGSARDYDGDEGEFDLDLEKAANDALSQWFGIKLSNLARPIRVVYLFERVRDECTVALQDEGHYVAVDSNDASKESSPGPCDVGEGGNHSSEPRSYGHPVRPGESPGAGSRKRSSNGGGDGADGSDTPDFASAHEARPRGSHHKRRRCTDFSCPFRKRNPLKFNVRDHEDCANKSYPSLPLLKRHLLVRHIKRTVQCPRCREIFSTAHHLLGHLLRTGCASSVSQGLLPLQSDPEDGFDESIEKLLRSRAKTDAMRVDTWVKMYRELFGSEGDVPSPEFEPVIEHHEVAVAFTRLPQPERDTFFAGINGSNPTCIARSIAGFCQRTSNTVESVAADSIPTGSITQTPRDSPHSAVSHGSQLAGGGFHVVSVPGTESRDEASLPGDYEVVQSIPHNPRPTWEDMQRRPAGPYLEHGDSLEAGTYGPPQTSTARGATMNYSAEACWTQIGVGSEQPPLQSAPHPTVASHIADFAYDDPDLQGALSTNNSGPAQGPFHELGTGIPPGGIGDDDPFNPEDVDPVLNSDWNLGEEGLYQQWADREPHMQWGLEQ